MFFLLNYIFFEKQKIIDIKAYSTEMPKGYMTKLLCTPMSYAMACSLLIFKSSPNRELNDYTNLEKQYKNPIGRIEKLLNISANYLFFSIK